MKTFLFQLHSSISPGQGFAFLGCTYMFEADGGFPQFWRGTLWNRGEKSKCWPHGGGSSPFSDFSWGFG